MTTIKNLFELAIRSHQSGNLPRAEALYRQVLQLDPANANAHFNLGSVLKNQGKMGQAVECYRQVLTNNPDHAGAYNNLGNALRELGQLAEAEDCYGQALRINPNHVEAYFNLGNTLRDKGQHADAEACYRQALRINSRHAPAYLKLGNVLRDQGRFAEAEACYRQALAINPDQADAHNNLGIGLSDQGNSAEAQACYRQALRIDPDYADAYHNLGLALKDEGQLDEAITCHERARSLKPQTHAYHSALLGILHYHPRYDGPAIREAHRQWEKEHACGAGFQPAFNSPVENRSHVLRIGYVSPDFCDHVVGRNVWPLLHNHDPKLFDITLYANQIKTDGMTERFQASCRRWRRIDGWTDEQVADQIRQDGIDILVDLALHTAGNRLLVLARKPAPVQVTFAGYPGTTGLSAIDYRFTDPYLDPPGLHDDWYAEASYRLPHSFWCYDPQTEEPSVAPLPALQNGFITFGCLNNFCKINDEVLALWARVLHAVPGARLLLLTNTGSQRQRMLDFLAKSEIVSDRVEFCSFRPRPEYLSTYHRIDIGLDTFPYNGHTTSLDSLWMGVPIVTLVGQTVVGRAGLSQLSNIGLAELATSSPEEFVRLAVDVAGDIPRLQTLRSGLRQRMRQGPLMDAMGFTRGIEEAYQVMWRKFHGLAGSASDRTSHV